MCRKVSPASWARGKAGRIDWGKPPRRSPSRSGQRSRRAPSSREVIAVKCAAMVTDSATEVGTGRRGLAGLAQQVGDVERCGVGGGDLEARGGQCLSRR